MWVGDQAALVQIIMAINVVVIVVIIIIIELIKYVLRIVFHRNADNETPRIQLSYSFKEEYSMADLSPSSFEDLVLRSVDRILF